MNVSKVETISFMKSISAETSETLAERIKANGTIEGMRVKFYPGPEGEFTIRPMIRHTGDRMEDLITYPSTTNKYLSGEDEVIILNVNTQVSNDDEIVLEINNPTLNDYTLNVQIEVDYYGGHKRIIGGAVIG